MCALSFRLVWLMKKSQWPGAFKKFVGVGETAAVTLLLPKAW